MISTNTPSMKRFTSIMLFGSIAGMVPSIWFQDYIGFEILSTSFLPISILICENLLFSYLPFLYLDFNIEDLSGDEFILGSAISNAMSFICSFSILGVLHYYKIIQLHIPSNT
jgi:hypothetical protein